MDRSADNLGQTISNIQRDLEELKSNQGTGGGGGGGGGEEYFAGNGIDIDQSNTISVDTNVVATKSDLSNKQDKLTAGSHISISDNNTISATGIPTKTSDLTNDGADGSGAYVDSSELEKYYRSLVPFGTAITTQGTDLNTITYLSVGKYYCSANNTAATLLNCPTDKAFMMEVFNPLSTDVDDETTRNWVYRTRLITTYEGRMYMQAANSSATAGVFTYGDWEEITQSGDLATVATTGDYDDLTNKPTIPAAQVNSDWNASSGVAEILNKPNLATVATSGSYNDLSNKPTIPTVNNATLTIQKNGTTVQTFTANQATAATANITVPTKTSDITNDSGFATYSGDNICGQGKNISLSTPANAPLASFKLDGETSQNGTPTPSAPVPVQTTTGENVVQICGKNLFDKTTATQNYRIGSDGLPYGDNSYFISDFIPVNPNTNYEISPAGTTSDYGSSATAYYDSNRGFISRTLGVNSGWQHVSAPANCAYIRFTTNKNVIDTAQLELGSTATTYEPYQGQSYEVNLGKNLFDKTDFTGVTDHYIGGGGRYTKANGNNVAIMRIEPNTTYTVSKEVQAINNRLRVGIADELVADSTVFSIWGGGDTATSVTLTSGSNSKYMYIYYAISDNASTALESLQLEKGSQATSYAAYFEPIELCKIGDYQDSIYKSGGKWYVHKECGNSTRDVAIAAIASDNTSGATKVSAEGAFLMFSGDWGSDYATTAGVARLSANVGTYKLDADITGNTGARAMESGTFCQRQGTNDRIYFRNTAFIGKTGNEVKSLLAQSGGANLWYPLATPTDTEITNATLITQLETLLTTARTYAGTNNITTITPNEQGTLEMCFKGGIASSALMAGCSATTNGLPGLVPAPAAGDQEKYLRGDGTWQPAGSSSDIPDGAVTTAKLADSAVTTAKIDGSAVTTAKIANNAVTASKIDFTSFIAGTANFTAVSAGGANDVSVNIPTQANTDYLIFLQLAGHTGYWTNLVYRPGTKTTTSFTITAYNSGNGSSGSFQIHYLVIPQ